MCFTVVNRCSLDGVKHLEIEPSKVRSRYWNFSERCSVRVTGCVRPLAFVAGSQAHEQSWQEAQ